MNSDRKIERALKKTLALAAVWLLVGAGSPAEAAKVLGLSFARPVDSAETAKIMLIDTATGTSEPVGDTGLTSSSTDGPNGMFGPNGLAYDPPPPALRTMRQSPMPVRRGHSTRW